MTPTPQPVGVRKPQAGARAPAAGGRALLSRTCPLQGASSSSSSPINTKPIKDLINTRPCLLTTHYNPPCLLATAARTIPPTTKTGLPPKHPNDTAIKAAHPKLPTPGLLLLLLVNPRPIATTPAAPGLRLLASTLRKVKGSVTPTEVLELNWLTWLQRLRPK